MSLEDIREKKTPITTLTGETKYLLFTLNAFAEIEETYESINNALSAIGDFRIKTIIDFIKVGLQHDNKEITNEEVSNLFDVGDSIKAVNEALKKAMPESKEEKEESEKNEQNPATQ